MLNIVIFVNFLVQMKMARTMFVIVIFIYTEVLFVLSAFFGGLLTWIFNPRYIKAWIPGDVLSTKLMHSHSLLDFLGLDPTTAVERIAAFHAQTERGGAQLWEWFVLLILPFVFLLVDPFMFAIDLIFSRPHPILLAFVLYGCFRIHKGWHAALDAFLLVYNPEYAKSIGITANNG